MAESAPTLQILPNPTSGRFGTPGTHQRRVAARVLDLAIAGGLGLLAFPLGAGLALLYVLAADAIWPGQSLGKRLFGVRVVRRIDGTTTRLWHSIVRNLPLAVAAVVGLVPVLGVPLFVVLGLPLFLLEVRFCRSGQRGRRMGDILAETFVTDMWTPLPAASLPPPTASAPPPPGASMPPVAPVSPDAAAQP